MGRGTIFKYDVKVGFIRGHDGGLCRIGPRLGGSPFRTETTKSLLWRLKHRTRFFADPREGCWRSSFYTSARLRRFVSWSAKN
jgi:hypothetical protein